MWNLNVDHAVSHIVEAILPRHSPQNHGLMITLNLSMHVYDEYENDEDMSSSRRAHFLFLRPTNYTKVLAAEGPRRIDIKPNDWKMYSDHDSCWRSDGFRILNKLYLDMRNELDPDPQSVHPISMHCFIDKILPVTVEYEKYKQEDKGYLGIRPTKIEFRFSND